MHISIRNYFSIFRNDKNLWKVVLGAVFLMPMLVCGISNGQTLDQSKTGTKQKTSNPQLGSEKSPFYVKKLTTAEEKAVVDEERNERDKKSLMDAAALEIAKDARTAAIDAANYAKYGLIISFSLALIALSQFFMFYIQLGLMKTSNATAENAAKAALIQAQSTMDAERAYVKLTHLAPGIETIDEHSSVVSVEVKNWGNTPAHVTDVMIDFRKQDYGEPLQYPTPNPNTQRESFPNAFLVPNESFNVERHVRTQTVSDTSGQLWVFGYVDYIDVFDQRWRGGFARKFVNRNDNNLVYNTEARDNFDRPRTPQEGIDWDEKSIAAYNARTKTGSL